MKEWKGKIIKWYINKTFQVGLASQLLLINLYKRFVVVIVNSGLVTFTELSRYVTTLSRINQLRHHDLNVSQLLMSQTVVETRLFRWRRSCTSHSVGWVDICLCQWLRKFHWNTRKCMRSLSGPGVRQWSACISSTTYITFPCSGIGLVREK